MKFSEIVKCSLLADLGLLDFKLSIEEDSKVTFESTNKRLSFFLDCDRYLYEIDVELSWKEWPNQSVKLSELVRFRKLPLAVPFQARSIHEIPKGVKLVFDSLLEQIPNIKDLKMEELSNLAKQATLLRKVETQQYINGPIRRHANMAWEAKDFHKVVKAYEAVRDELTEIEQRRLSYARAHLLESGDSAQ